MRTVRFVIFLILLNALAKAQPLRFSQLNVNHGLSQNSVYSIAFDKHEVMWVGTADGLNRYDGYQFTTFHHGGLKNTLFNTGVYALQCQGHNLWIAGDKGIEVFNTETQTSTFIHPLHSQAKQLLWFQLDNPNELYLMANSSGLWRITCNTLKMEAVTFTQEPNGWQNDLYNCSVIPQKQNTFLFFKTHATDYFEVDLNKRSIIAKKLFNNAATFLSSNVVEQDARHLLFESRTNNTVHLHCWNRRTGQFERTVPFKNGPGQIQNLLYLTDQKALLISDQFDGLVWLDDKLQISGTYPNSAIIGLTVNEAVYHVLYRHRNTLWLGSDPHGINYCNLNDERFWLYREHLLTTPAIIKGVFTDRFNNVYSCAYDGPVSILDYNSTKIGEMPRIAANGTQSLYIVAFDQFLPVTKDEVFIYCSNFLGIYNTYTKHYKDWYPLFSSSVTRNYNLNNYSAAFVLDSNEIWIGHENKIFVLRPNAKTQAITYHSAHTATISSLYVCDANCYLIGADNGLWISTKKGRYQVKAIGAILIKNILKAKNGHYWISTVQGLWELNSNFEILHSWKEENGLANSFIYGALEQGEWIWFSHNRGLSAINTGTYAIHNYSLAHGLQANEFNTNTFWKSDQGCLYFGGINGITAIPPGFTTPKQFPIQCELSNLQINDSPFQTIIPQDSVLVLDLPFKQNTISIAYAGLVPEKSSLLTYRYQLLGFDSKPVEAGVSRNVRYAELPAGDYRFVVYCSINGEQWSDTTLLLLHIHPPYYQTWWFRLLLVFICITLLVLVFRFFYKQREKQLKIQIEQMQRIQEERARISRDLHDNAGAIVTHMIMELEDAEQLSKHELHRRLLQMQQSGRSLMNTLRETIWALNEKPISAFDFTDKLITYCQKYISIPSTFTNSLSEDHVLPKESVLHLYRICQELLHNAVKHSKATLLTIHISADEKLLLLIEICDNGVGFDPTAIQTNEHYGIKNMHKRAQEAGAQLNFKSEIGKGTCVQIILPQPSA